MNDRNVVEETIETLLKNLILIEAKNISKHDWLIDWKYRGTQLKKS